MTPAEAEAWLTEHRPSHHWSVHPHLGIGLPMRDGVMFYAPLGREPIEMVADYVAEASQKGHA